MHPRQMTKELNQFIDEPVSSKINKKDNNNSRANNEEKKPQNANNGEKRKNNFSGFEN